LRPKPRPSTLSVTIYVLLSTYPMHASAERPLIVNLPALDNKNQILEINYEYRFLFRPMFCFSYTDIQVILGTVDNSKNEEPGNGHADH
jgi:hypothetical protein